MIPHPNSTFLAIRLSVVLIQFGKLSMVFFLGCAIFGICFRFRSFSVCSLKFHNRFQYLSSTEWGTFIWATWLRFLISFWLIQLDDMARAFSKPHKKIERRERKWNAHLTFQHECSSCYLVLVSFYIFFCGAYNEIQSSTANIPVCRDENLIFPHQFECARLHTFYYTYWLLTKFFFSHYKHEIFSGFFYLNKIHC